MLCDCCGNLSSTDGLGSYGQAAPKFRPIDRMVGRHCFRCGRPLSLAEPLDAMLRKLAQLARFGLGAGAGPLLISSRQEG